MAEDSKRAIIVGIPGVGKTTVIGRTAELLNRQTKANVVVFGTLMFEEAKSRLGIKHRDEMRSMPVADQRRLQEMAAQRISEMEDDVVLVDTHLFINTREGYYPGLPMRLLNIMKPTNLVMIAADPQEIVDRRTTDKESAPLPLTDGRIAFRRGDQFLAIDPRDGRTESLADLRFGEDPESTKEPEGYLQEQQRQLFDVLARRAAKKRETSEAAEQDPNPALRGMATDALGDVQASDLATLRKLMKSNNRSTGVRAAARVLAVLR